MKNVHTYFSYIIKVKVSNQGQVCDLYQSYVIFYFNTH